jgi:hypothetical protein
VNSERCAVAEFGSFSDKPGVENWVGKSFGVTSLVIFVEKTFRSNSIISGRQVGKSDTNATVCPPVMISAEVLNRRAPTGSQDSGKEIIGKSVEHSVGDNESFRFLNDDLSQLS